MFTANATADSFRVVADNAIDYIAGTQAAGAVHIGKNIQRMAGAFHADTQNISNAIVDSSNSIAEINQNGFDAVQGTLQTGITSLGVISAVNIAVQAAGFVAVSNRLRSVDGSIQALDKNMERRAAELADLQKSANATLETLADFATRTFHTQEKILETLVSSRTTEAQQLVRQGWDNYKHGYIDDAFARFLKSLDFDNTIYVAHAQIAAIYRTKKNNEKAEDHYRRAIVFSSNAGPEIQAYAHIQYANFLEEIGRPADALAEAEKSLLKADHSEWTFYYCELLVTNGKTDAALERLSSLIENDSRYFEISQLSPKLAGLGTRLLTLLIGVDKKKREVLLSACESLANEVVASEEFLTTLLSRDDDPLGQIRKAGADALTAALTSPFHQLDNIHSAISAASAELRNTLMGCISMAAEEYASRCRLESQRCPKTPEPIRRKILFDKPAKPTLFGIYTPRNRRAWALVLAITFAAWILALVAGEILIPRLEEGSLAPQALIAFQVILLLPMVRAVFGWSHVRTYEAELDQYQAAIREKDAHTALMAEYTSALEQTRTAISQITREALQRISAAEAVIRRREEQAMPFPTEVKARLSEWRQQIAPDRGASDATPT